MGFNYRNLLKNTGLLAISNFSSKILVFLLVPLYTNVLTTTEYGVFDLVYTTIQLLFPILTISICDSVMRFIMSENDSNDEVFTIGVRLTLIASILFGVGIYIVSRLSNNSYLNMYCFWITIYFIGYIFNNLFIQYAKGNDYVIEISVASVIGTLALVLGNIFVLLVCKLGLKGFFIANAMGQVIPCVYYFIKLRLWRHIVWQIKKDLFVRMLIYSAPLIVNTLGWWFNNTSDRYIVSLLCGVDQNGLISVAYKIPSIITVLSGVFIQAWQISVIEEYENDNKIDQYSEMFLIFNGLLGVVTLTLIVFTKPLARIFFAKDFYNSWIFVPMLLISAMFNEIAGFIGPILSAEFNTKALARSAIIGIALNFGLNIIFTLLIGPLGITIATAIASFAIYFFRERNTNGEVRGYEYKRVCISWVIVTISSILTVLSVPLWIVSIALVIEIYIYRDVICNLIKKCKFILVRKK